MANEDTIATTRRSRVPLVASGILFLCLVGLIIYIWMQYTAWMEQREATALAQEQERSAQIVAQKAKLEPLLAEDACTVKDKLAEMGILPVPGAELPDASSSPVNQPQGGAAPIPPALPAGTPEASGQTAPAPAAQTQSGKDIPVADIEKACVFIVSMDAEQNGMTGSGFFVAPGYVATNRHVVESHVGRILVTSKALGQPCFAKDVARAEGDRDYALLKVELPADANVTILPFASSAQRTEKVGAWGYPNVVGKNDPAYQSLLNGEDIRAVPEISYSDGVVSAMLDRTPPLIVHTAPISPGNSGGPLLNASGRVVGINTMITLDEDSYRQASIAASGTDLAVFLQKNGVSVETR